MIVRRLERKFQRPRNSRERGDSPTWKNTKNNKIDRLTLIVDKADYIRAFFMARPPLFGYNIIHSPPFAGYIVFVVNIIGTYICLVAFAFKL